MIRIDENREHEEAVKVVVVGSDLKLTGSSISLLRIGEVFSMWGWTLTVVLPAGMGPMVSEVKKRGWPLYRLDVADLYFGRGETFWVRYWLRRLKINLRLAVQLQQVCENSKSDLLYVNNTAVRFPMLRIKSRGSCGRVIYHVREYSGMWLRDWLMGLALRFRADATIANSAACAKNLNIIGNAKIVYNSLPRNREMELLAIPSAKGLVDLVNIGFFGQALPHKGLDILLEAVGGSGCLRSNCKVTAIGVSESQNYEYYARCNEIINSQAMSVDMIPPQQDIVPYMENSDVVVVPSRREAFGLVAIEAMAAGRPVIVTPVGGLPEVVIAGVSGWVCSSLSVESVRECLEQAVMNRELRLYFSEGARQDYLRRFSCDMWERGVAGVLKAEIGLDKEA